MPSDTDTESEQSAPELLEDDDNRLSEDEEFPISEDEFEGSAGGWAGSMLKVLKSDKSTVLSKAKKVEDVAKKKETKPLSFEIEGEIKQEKDDQKPSEDALKRALVKRKYRERKENKLRVFNLRLKPSVADLDRERTFKKISTRGVVQLFNAVKNQQSEIKVKLQNTKLESKREEIIRSTDTKREFLNKLMSGPRAKSELVDRVKGVKKEESMSEDESDDDDDGNEGKSNWSALRNDFMTGKKVGWDKDEDSDDDDPGSAEESDSD